MAASATPASIPDSAAKKSLAAPALIIFIFTFCVYWPSLHAQFHPVDDWQYLTANPYVVRPSWQGLVAVFCEVWKPSTVMGYYQPLAMASLMLDRFVQLSASPHDTNVSPFVFHFTSILLHAANSVLVFVLVRRLTGRGFAAFLCGLFFAVHPINVECVTWISQRKSVLSTQFMLIAVLSHIRFAVTKRWAWYGATIVAYAASVLSKPTGLFLPLVLLMIDSWPLRRFNFTCILGQIPNFIIAGLAAWVAHHSQLTYFDYMDWDKYWTVWQTILIACHGLMFYVSKTFLPLGLLPEYLIAGESEIALSSPQYVFGVVGTLVLFAVFVRAVWRRDTAAWTLMASYVILLASTLTPMKYQESIAADRFAYIPMVFLLVLMAELGGHWMDRVQARVDSIHKIRTIGGILGVATILSLISPNLHQQEIRRDSLSYYTSIANGYPNLPRGQFSRGRVLMLEHDLMVGEDDSAKASAGEKIRLAEAAFGQVIRIEPDYVAAYYSLAEVLIRQGRLDEGIAVIKQGMTRPGAGWVGYRLLGAAYASAGRFAEAVPVYEEYLKFQPDSALARNNLASALLQVGRVAEALTQYERLLELDPMDLDGMQNWGVALIMAGQVRQAAEILRDVVTRRRAAVAAQPEIAAKEKLADTEYTLAGALAILGDTSGARAFLVSAIRTKPILDRDFVKNPVFANLRAADQVQKSRPEKDVVPPRDENSQAGQ